MSIQMANDCSLFWKNFKDYLENSAAPGTALAKLKS